MKLTNEQRSQMIAEYQNGAKISFLSKKYGINNSSVQKSLNKAKIAKRCRHEECRQYFVNDTYFDTIDTADKAYWLGFLFADGGINKNTLVLQLNTIDKSHLEKLKIVLNSTHPIKTKIITKVYKNEKRQYIHSLLAIGCKKLCQSLSKYGVIENKTYKTNTLPNIQYFADFVRGYLDGDGWIITNHKKRKKQQYGFGIVGYQSSLLIELKQWFNQNGVYGGMLRTKNNKTTLTFCGNNVFQLITKLIYNQSNMYLDRKYKHIQEILSKLS